jgi:hypothetical protein
MPHPTAVLFQTYFFDASLARLFARLIDGSPSNFRSFVLIHVSPGAPKPPRLTGVPHHFVTTPEIRDPGYRRKSSGGPEWRIWDGGHTDLPLLHFARAHPEFERYWVVEYDTRFGGPWSRLFATFEDNPADFLSTSLRTASTNPEWPYWPTLQPPADDPTDLPPDERICCFMPVFRASRAAVRTMDAAYRAGWGGHCETTWPTILRRQGLRVEDLGGTGAFVPAANRGRFYTSTPTAWDLSPGTFVFKPARSGFFLRRGMLYHPIKPVRATCTETLWRARAKLASLLRRPQPLLPQSSPGGTTAAVTPPLGPAPRPSLYRQPATAPQGAVRPAIGGQARSFGDIISGGSGHEIAHAGSSKRKPSAAPGV